MITDHLSHIATAINTNKASLGLNSVQDNFIDEFGSLPSLSIDIDESYPTERNSFAHKHTLSATLLGTGEGTISTQRTAIATIAETVAAYIETLRLNQSTRYRCRTKYGYGNLAGEYIISADIEITVETRGE
jgi:hypothetical protein